MTATIVYDDACDLCRRIVAWVAVRDVERRFDTLPCRSPERAQRFPWLSEADCLAAVQYVGEDGVRASAAAAVGRILCALPGWRWLGRLVSFPPLRPLMDRGYRWVAVRRRCGGPRPSPGGWAEWHRKELTDLTADEPARPAEALLRAAFDLSGQQADVLVDLTAAAATASLTREQAIEAAGVLAGRRYAVLHEDKAVRLTHAGTEAAANRRF